MKQYCSQCDKETQHTERCIRDADTDPDPGFRANGDSVYEQTCQECGHTIEVM